MSFIEILRGLPASGKSTYAKAMAANSSDVVRVNRDGIRWTQGIRDGLGTKEQEDLVTIIEEAMVIAAIKAGKNVVIDAMHLNPAYARRWFKIAKAHSVRNVRVIDFEVPIAELFERDANREKSVGQGVIAKLASRWGVEDDGGIKRKLTYNAAQSPDLTPAAEWDDMLPTAWIVDTDGTLANHEGIRSPYDTSRYHLDTVHQDVAALVHMLAEDTHIIGVSGRDEEFREVTEAWWLSEARLKADEFYFRPAGDVRPDDVIKAEIYEKHIRGRYNIAGVLDDRGRVLRMWRAKGLTTFAVGDTDNNNF